MINLTPGQLMDIQVLVRNHKSLFSEVGMTFHGNGLMQITIISVLNADQSKIDRVLEQIFPDMQYRGSAATYSDASERYELHFIDYNGETLINLCMKKTSALTEVEKKIVQSDYTTGSQKLEPEGM